MAGNERSGSGTAFERGEFLPLRDWLRRKIHEAGQCYSAAELVERVTGQHRGHCPRRRATSLAHERGA